MKQKVLRLAYAALCFVLAVIALQFALDEWRTRLPGTAAGGLILFVLDALFFATALSALLRWRARTWLAGASGVVLILYAVSVLTMGWEDVGGARGALPLAVPTAILGGWSIAVAINAWLEKGEAV